MNFRHCLFLVATVSSFLMPIIDANAKSGSCSAGSYLLTSKCHNCPGGCYCTGGNLTSFDHKNKISDGQVAQWCARQRQTCDHSYKDGYGACGRPDNAHIQRCPENFPKSDAKATSVDKCYTDANGVKLYYKIVCCEAGKYLPKNSATCVSCDQAGDNYYCPTETCKLPSTTEDQGLKTCHSTEKPSADRKSCEQKTQENKTVKCDQGQYVPANETKCSPCDAKPFKDRYFCIGGIFEVPKDITQGVSSCQDDYVTNETRDNCVKQQTKQETQTVYCAKGFYLPANKTEAKECTGNSKYCPGGTYTVSSIDQGIFVCPLKGTANNDHTACDISLGITQMKFGSNGKDSTTPCWTMSDSEDYKKCILGKK